MTPKSFDHDDLGIDLDRVRELPECSACRKKTDGWKRAPDGTILCGTHHDEWLLAWLLSGKKLMAAELTRELREGKYKPCWEAKLEE